MSYISRKILNYGLDLTPDEQFLKSELITSRFRISSKIQLDIHVALASYLTKMPLIYKHITIPNTKTSTEDDNIIEIVTDVNDETFHTQYYLFLLD